MYICAIASGQLKSELVYEDELTIAFLDNRPIREGHTQIIPREHYPCFDDAPAATVARMVHVGQQLAKALKNIHSVDRVAFLFTGGDVAHAHAHVVPILESTDITSRRYIAEQELTFRSTPQASSDELAAMAKKLKRIMGMATG